MEAIKENPFHSSDTQYVDNRKRLLKNAIDEKVITKDDCDLITEFIGSRITKIGPKRAYKYTTTLIGFKKKKFIQKPFRKVTKADFDNAIEAMQQYGFKINTKRDYTDFIKRFYLWLIKKGYSVILPGSEQATEILELSPGPKDKMTKTKESIFTEQEIEDMTRAAPGVMWKAIIATMFDGAMRPQEIGKLTWGQLSISDNKATINTSEKTGHPRNIPLYRAFPYLRQWKNEYPRKPTKEAYVFLNVYGQPLSYNVVRDHVKAIAKVAGVTRPVKLHNFRHTGITDMQKRGLNDTIIKKICWGSTDTDMLATYSHLSDDDADKAVAESLGIVIPGAKPAPKILEPQLCPKCAAICPTEYAYCPDCGAPLSKEAINESEHVNNMTEQYMIERMKEMERRLIAMEAKNK